MHPRLSRRWSTPAPAVKLRTASSDRWPRSEPPRTKSKPHRTSQPEKTNQLKNVYARRTIDRNVASRGRRKAFRHEPDPDDPVDRRRFAVAAGQGPKGKFPLDRGGQGACAHQGL